MFRLSEDHLDSIIGLVENEFSKIRVRESRWCDRSDILQEGLVGLVNGLKTYDPFTLIPIEGYVCYVSRRSMLRAMKKVYLENHRTSQIVALRKRYSERRISKTKEKNVQDPLPFWEMIKDIVGDKNYDIVRLKYKEEKTFEEIAEIRNCTKQNVQQCMSRILEKIRNNKMFTESYGLESHFVSQT